MERSAATGVARSEANQLRTSPAVAIGDRASREMRKDLIPQVAPVHIERSGLPDSLVTLEHGRGDGLEECLAGIPGCVLAAPDGGENRGGTGPGRRDIDGRGVAHDLPDAFPAMLAVDEPPKPTVSGALTQVVFHRQRRSGCC